MRQRQAPRLSYRRTSIRRRALDKRPDSPTIGNSPIRVELAELRAVIADLRQDRDHWRDAFENMKRALPAPQAAEKPMSCWRWLRSTG